METDFYQSIPPEIREKLQEYANKYSSSKRLLNERNSLIVSFAWHKTSEGSDFWANHSINNTFPIWSDELNRFINPPTNIDINENPNKFYPL